MFSIIHLLTATQDVVLLRTVLYCALSSPVYSALFIPVKCLILYLYSALLSTVQCIVVDRTASTLLWTVHVQLTQNSLYTALFVILLRVQCNSLYITLLSLRQYSLIPVSVIPSSVYCYPMCTALLSTVSCIVMSCTGKYTAPYCTGDGSAL